MLALTLAQWLAALSNLALVIFIAMAVVYAAITLVGRKPLDPWRHEARERRRHAERTARAMRRMSRIRARTIRRMDEAERRWRP
jgi:hypothetical protein